MRGDVVIFAGAGVSTENSLVFKSTFYDDICAELGVDDLELSFPEAMERFENQHNGRRKLLDRLKRRFRAIDAFPEIRRNATRFHRELATFYPVDTVVTTNWDRFFEEECGATAFVDAEDLAFWETSGRKVLKIHGTIDAYGSIIATTRDYRKSKKKLQSGVVGSVLKLLLATKTIVYCGYSLRDADFLAINSFVQREMKQLTRQAYIVSPFIDDRDFSRYGVTPIKTDASHLISLIKDHALEELKVHYLPDLIYGAAEFMLDVVRENHRKLHKTYSSRENPEVIMCACYQDGLMHAFEQVLAMRPTGYYSHACNFANTLRPYEGYRRDFLRRKRYEDVAYIDGFVNGLCFVVNGEEYEQVLDFPLYYMFGSKGDVISFDDYESLVPLAPTLHKSAYKRAKEIRGKQLLHDETVEFHHFPWL